MPNSLNDIKSTQLSYYLFKVVNEKKHSIAISFHIVSKESMILAAAEKVILLQVQIRYVWFL